MPAKEVAPPGVRRERWPSAVTTTALLDSNLRIGLSWSKWVSARVTL